MAYPNSIEAISAQFAEQFCATMATVIQEVMQQARHTPIEHTDNQLKNQAQPKQRQKLLICGYTEDEDCLCEVTDSIQSVYQDESDEDDVVLDLKEEEGHQNQLQSRQNDDPVGPEVGDPKWGHAGVQNYNHLQPENDDQMNHFEANSLSLSEFSVDNFELRKYSTNLNGLPVAGKVFDEILERKLHYKWQPNTKGIAETQPPTNHVASKINIEQVSGIGTHGELFKINDRNRVYNNIKITSVDRVSGGIHVVPYADDFSTVWGNMKSPVSTPSENGVFLIKLLSHGFPQLPPKCYFMIFYPKIATKGEIYVKTLKSDDDLSLDLHSPGVVRLLIKPFPNSIGNEQVGKLLIENYYGYASFPTFFTKIYCLEPFDVGRKLQVAGIPKRNKDAAIKGGIVDLAVELGSYVVQVKQLHLEDKMEFEEGKQGQAIATLNVRDLADIVGLVKSGFKEPMILAEDITMRWVRFSYASYHEIGIMIEVYEVKICGAHGVEGDDSNWLNNICWKAVLGVSIYFKMEKGKKYTHYVFRFDGIASSTKYTYHELQATLITNYKENPMHQHEIVFVIGVAISPRSTYNSRQFDIGIMIWKLRLNKAGIHPKGIAAVLENEVVITGMVEMGILYQVHLVPCISVGRFGKIERFLISSLKSSLIAIHAWGAAFVAVASLSQMGLACVQLYVCNEAAELFEEAKTILEAEYAPHHHDTINVYSNLVTDTYDACGKDKPGDNEHELKYYAIAVNYFFLRSGLEILIDDKKDLGLLTSLMGIMTYFCCVHFSFVDKHLNMVELMELGVLVVELAKAFGLRSQSNAHNHGGTKVIADITLDTSKIQASNNAEQAILANYSWVLESLTSYIMTTMIETSLSFSEVINCSETVIWVQRTFKFCYGYKHFHLEDKVDFEGGSIVTYHGTNLVKIRIVI